LIRSTTGVFSLSSKCFPDTRPAYPQFGAQHNFSEPGQLAMAMVELDESITV